MSPELLTAVQDAIALLESWRGQLVRVDETLARSTGDGWEYDRHGCTHSGLSLVVEYVGWRFSGSALMVHGALSGRECGYEVSLDAVVSVRRPDGASVALKERFGRAAERVSVFRLVGSPQDAEPDAAADGGGL
jgi:hypothetical protein